LRSRSVERFRRRPAETQRKELERLLRECARTEFGRRYGFGEIRTPEAFAQRVERFDYTSFKPYVERMMAGEADVAAPGRVRWFARSSGTTSERSKYLPVTDVSLWRCHTRGLRDVATLYVGQYPSTRVFEGKTLTLGGTCSKSGGIVVGDLSALLVERTPFWSGWFRTPRRETALLADFDEKVERICRECASERVTAFAGVPSWNLALLRRMVEYTGRRNLCEVWPHLELFAHGGVGFEPYRAAFRELIPSAGMHYMETYNASEGFFAIADDASLVDMLLMLDYGTPITSSATATRWCRSKACRRGGGMRCSFRRSNGAVALRVGRRGGVHLDRSLPDSGRRAYAPVHQRFRRGGGHGK